MEETEDEDEDNTEKEDDGQATEIQGSSVPGTENPQHQSGSSASHHLVLVSTSNKW